MASTLLGSWFSLLATCSNASFCMLDVSISSSRIATWLPYGMLMGAWPGLQSTDSYKPQSLVRLARPSCGPLRQLDTSRATHRVLLVGSARNRVGRSSPAHGYRRSYEWRQRARRVVRFAGPPVHPDGDPLPPHCVPGRQRWSCVHNRSFSTARELGHDDRCVHTSIFPRRRSSLPQIAQPRTPRGRR